jgi:hypothetical protein
MRTSTHRGPCLHSCRAFRPCRTQAAAGNEPPPPSGPADTVLWGGTLPSRRRAFLGTLSASGIALGGNLGGVTSSLLNTQPAAARALRLDCLFPVTGYLRHIDAGLGFEFLHPSSWLADQTLARRRAAAVEAQSSLDPPSLAQRRRRSSGEPVIAFGPPGSTGEENLSVVVQDANAYGVLFRLQNLGSPQQVADGLLSNVIARPGSNKTASLISATERRDGSYQLEYTVQSSAPAVWERHFLSVLTGDSTGRLLTFTVQVPAELWTQSEETLRPCSDSFAVWT